MNQDQFDKIKAGGGFIAALDQSGGSTPKALQLYGVDESAYASEAEMFDQIHAMRSRIITSPAFDGDRVVGAILFEMTMDRQVEGIDTAAYLWNEKQVVPFLKVDKALEDEVDGAQVMGCGAGGFCATGETMLCPEVDGGWTTVVGTFTATSGAATFRLHGESSFDAYFDSISVVADGGCFAQHDPGFLSVVIPDDPRCPLLRPSRSWCVHRRLRR